MKRVLGYSIAFVILFLVVCGGIYFLIHAFRTTTTRVEVKEKTVWVEVPVIKTDTVPQYVPVYETVTDSTEKRRNDSLVSEIIRKDSVIAYLQPSKAKIEDSLTINWVSLFPAESPDRKLRLDSTQYKPFGFLYTYQDTTAQTVPQEGISLLSAIVATILLVLGGIFLW